MSAGFLNHLASLVVNIVINTRQFNQGMNGVQNRLVSGAAGFYLLRSAMLTSVGAMNSIVQATAKIEEGFIKIERVAKEVRGGSFREDIKNQITFELPGVKIEEYQKILKIAAQLGIQGKNDLEKFGAQVAILANVTGLNAERIATHLGKLLTVFKISPSDAEPIINAVLKVADDLVVTEEEILSITEKLGGYANAIGLSAEETIAFAGAMKSVGQTTEVSRTALFTLFQGLAKSPFKVGKALGLSNEEIVRLAATLKSNPFKAIHELLELLHKTPIDELSPILKSLGAAGVRNAAALKALADNLEVLDKAMASSTQGAEQNVKLTQDQALEAAGLTSKLTDLKNAWDLWLASMGEGNGVITGTIGLLKELLIGLREYYGASKEKKFGVGVDLDSEEALEKKIHENKDARDKILSEPLLGPKNSGFGYSGMGTFHPPGQVAEATRLKEENDKLRLILSKLKQSRIKKETTPKEEVSLASYEDNYYNAQKKVAEQQAVIDEKKKNKDEKEEKRKLAAAKKIALAEAKADKLADRMKFTKSEALEFIDKKDSFKPSAGFYGLTEIWKEVINANIAKQQEEAKTMQELLDFNAKEVKSLNIPLEIQIQRLDAILAALKERTPTAIAQ